MLQKKLTNEEIKPTLQNTLTNEEIKPPLPRLDASELLVPGGGQVEEPEDCLVEVAALNDEEPVSLCPQILKYFLSVDKFCALYQERETAQTTLPQE